MKARIAVSVAGSVSYNDVDSDAEAAIRGVPGAGGADAGRTVCACFQVGINTLRQAIAEQGLSTPEAIGTALKAGTNCGSCVPELRQLLATTSKAA